MIFTCIVWFFLICVRPLIDGNQAIDSTLCQRQKIQNVEPQLSLDTESYGIIHRHKREPDKIRWQTFANQIRRQTSISPLEQDGSTSLNLMLSDISQKHFTGCFLVVAFDAVYEHSRELNELLLTPNPIQVLKVKDEKDFLSLNWVSSRCVGYVFLLGDPTPISSFMDEAEEPWDFNGKYVFVGLSKDILDTIVFPKKGKKTEQIIGLVKETNNDWLVYANQLYWGNGTKTVNRWIHNGFTSDGNIFPDKTSDLRGAKLTYVTYEFRPHVNYVVDEYGGRYFGKDLDLVNTLAKSMNFTYRIITPLPSELWGVKLENGSWNGAIGFMQRNEAHFLAAGSFLSDTNNMTLALSYSRFYDFGRACFMARVEPPLPRWQSLIRPLHSSTWLSLAIAFCLVSLVFYAFAATFFHTTGDKNSKNLGYIVLITLGIHLRGSQPKTPKMTTSRILVASIWVYVVVVTTGYSCNLTAHLTKRKTPTGPETFADLHFQGHKIYEILEFFVDFFKTTENKHVAALHDRFISIENHQESYDALLSGEGVLMDDRNIEEYIIVKEFTERGVPLMRIMKQCHAVFNMVVGVQKHSPLKEKFDDIIGKVFDGGLVRKWLDNSLTKLKQTDGKSGGNRSDMFKEIQTEERTPPLGIAHMQGLFFIYLLGLIMSLLTFLAEVCCESL